MFSFVIIGDDVFSSLTPHAHVKTRRLELQRQALIRFSTCSCNNGMRLKTMVRTDPQFLIKLHVSAECVYPTNGRNSSKNLIDAEAAQQTARDKYRAQQAVAQNAGWTNLAEEALLQEQLEAEALVIVRQGEMTLAKNLECCAVECQGSGGLQCPQCWLPLGPTFVIPQCPP